MPYTTYMTKFEVKCIILDLVFHPLVHTNCYKPTRRCDYVVYSIRNGDTETESRTVFGVGPVKRYWTDTVHFILDADEVVLYNCLLTRPSPVIETQD